MTSRALLWSVLALALALPARAAPNDINLLGLVDNNGRRDQAAFYEMTTELGLILTPSPMQPAETTGQSGFDMGLELNAHVISFWKDYWTNSRVGTTLEGRAPIIPTIETLGVRGRKGFILPIPLTSEIELGAQWLVESRLVLVGAKWRVALNEGFRWIPDVGVGLGINRLIGSDDLYLTTVTAGAQVSKGFSLFGDVDITPFLNYESIFVDARTRLIDPGPSNTSDVGNLINFDPAPAIAINNPDIGQCAADPLNCIALNRYDRVSVGTRFQVALVQVSLGLDVDILARRIGTDNLPVMFHGGARFGMLF